MTLTHDLGRQVFGDVANDGKLISIDEARELLYDWMDNPKLRLHCEQVGHLMKRWAESKGYAVEIVHAWHLAGLLHDADWEKYPEEHCGKIIEELESRNVSPDVLHAIASHGPRYFGVDPVSEMDKMIYLFDELSGFIHAYSLMRSGYDGMEVSSVKKKLKDKGFAAQVSRDDINDASARASVSIDEIIKFIIENQLQSI
jgi:predicted hydrolase (HD superfamily)